MDTDRKPPGSATPERRSRAAWLLVALLVTSASGSACSSDSPAPAPSLGDCDGRAEPISAGMKLSSEQGYGFELSRLEPSIPVQSDSPPGNRWTVSITDPSGAKVIGATLAVNTYMPDHGHSGPPAVAVETSDGSYDVADLVFPMPTLYSISFLLTLASGDKQTATLMLCLDVVSG